MATDTLRAWWSYRQGLDGRLLGASPQTILRETGWARSVGGVAPYLTLKSRGNISRAEADASAAELSIHELPAIRGCTYVLPADEFGLALAAGAPFREPEMKTAIKLGVTAEEIDGLCQAVVQALERGTLSPDEIRDATGDASRSLGEEGKKKGLTTTLPLALGKLQAQGVIRRVPIDGRQDQQRYKYALWKTNPRESFSLSEEEIQSELAHRFLKWIGPATLGEFQWFSGLGVGASKKALSTLETVELDGGMFLLKEQEEEFRSFKKPEDPYYRLVSSLDGISLLRRDLTSLLHDEDKDRKVFYQKSEQKIALLADLPNHAIVDRGRLVGLWEYDTFTSTIAWVSFVEKNAQLVAAVQEMETFIREELGDARSFSLDSPKSRIPAVEALRCG